MPITAPRRKRERRVVFELRSKPFELHDRKREMALYELCRLWVGGRDDGTDPADRELPSHTNVKNEPMGVLDDARLDLLATKVLNDYRNLQNVYCRTSTRYRCGTRRWRTSSRRSCRTPCPSRRWTMHMPGCRLISRDGRMSRNSKFYRIIHQFMVLRFRHVKHAFDRQQPYSKSLALLETVFSIAQENQV